MTTVDEPDEKPVDESTEPPAPEGTVCSECAAPLADDQTYCLECGTPTPLAPRLGRARGVGAVAVGLVALGLGTGGLAWAVASDRSGSPASSGLSTGLTTPTLGSSTLDLTNIPTTLPPDTSGTPSVPTTTSPTDTGFVTATSGTSTPTATGPGLTGDTSGGVTTPPTTGATTAATTDTETGGVTSTEDAASDWPSGRAAWTAVLASARNRGEAEGVRDRADQAGEDAGILVSADHSELKPGFFVVFSGLFSDRQTAIAHAAELKGDFAGAYARRISG